MRSLYQASGSIEAVLTYTGSYNGQPYPGLDPIKDAQLIESIGGHFERLQDPDSNHWDWPLQAQGVQPAQARRVG